MRRRVARVLRATDNTYITPIRRGRHSRSLGVLPRATPRPCRTRRSTPRPLNGAWPRSPSGANARRPARAGWSATIRSAPTWPRCSATPLLSREEEHELAVHYRETGDVEAAYRLVTSNLRLVVKIAHEYRRTAFQLLDLIQEGNIGLMQAVKKYDPWKGVKLSSYAAWWIRAYIIRFIMDNWRMVKLGTTQAQRKLFFNLTKEREKLLARGIEPTPRLLAKNLQVEESEVEEMAARMAADDLSLDAPVGPDGEESHQTRLDRVVDDGRGAADVQIGDEELRRVFRQKLEEFARTITEEKERYIFEHRLLPSDGKSPSRSRRSATGSSSPASGLARSRPS